MKAARRGCPGLFWFTLGGAIAAGLFAAEDPRAAPPNFVVIMAEAQGWANTSVAMDDRVTESRSRIFSTPAVERLAREGMRFARGYAASPRRTPSRAALFTGKSPAALRMTFVAAGGRGDAPVRTALIPPEPVLELPAGETTIAELLHGAGYVTAHFGKWHVGRVDPAKHGFDESDGANNNGGPDGVFNPNPKQSVALTERGIAFMTRAWEAGKPFYVQLSHYPNQERREGQSGGRPQEDVRADALQIDQTVTRLLTALDELGLTATTFVIYTSDHGAQGRDRNGPLAGGKGAVTEGGLRVPFLVRGPGIAAGACSRVPVTACDILPTVAELAAVKSPLPAGIEGGSLVPVLRDVGGRGTVTRAREELVFHFPHYDLNNGGPATAILLGGYKLLRNDERKTQRLYDLERDPGEAHDLAATEVHVVANLAARLTAYLKAVNAQLARPNPDFDPAKAGDGGDIRRGPNAGKQPRKRV